MTFQGFISIFSLLWFLGGALWLLLSPTGFVRFASLGTRQDLTPDQLKKARIVGCLALLLGVVIILEFLYGYIR